MSGLSGINQLADVARAARLAGGELPKKLKKGLTTLGPPAKKAVQEETQRLPSGYRTLLAKAVRVRVRADLGFTTAGVSVVTHATGKERRRDIPAINRGRLRHPVYGHRKRKWVTQRVQPGFWDDAMDTVSDDAHQRVRAVLDETTRTLKGAR